VKLIHDDELHHQPPGTGSGRSAPLERRCDQFDRARHATRRRRRRPSDRSDRLAQRCGGTTGLARRPSRHRVPRRCSHAPRAGTFPHVVAPGAGAGGRGAGRVCGGTSRRRHAPGSAPRTRARAVHMCTLPRIGACASPAGACSGAARSDRRRRQRPSRPDQRTHVARTVRRGPVRGRPSPRMFQDDRRPFQPGQGRPEHRQRLSPARSAVGGSGLLPAGTCGHRAHRRPSRHGPRRPEPRARALDARTQPHRPAPACRRPRHLLSSRRRPPGRDGRLQPRMRPAHGWRLRHGVARARGLAGALLGSRRSGHRRPDRPRPR